MLKKQPVQTLYDFSNQIVPRACFPDGIRVLHLLGYKLIDKPVQNLYGLVLQTRPHRFLSQSTVHTTSGKIYHFWSSPRACTRVVKMSSKKYDTKISTRVVLDLNSQHPQSTLYNTHTTFYKLLTNILCQQRGAFFYQHRSRIGVACAQACALRIGAAAPPRRQAPIQGANAHALQEDLDAHWGG